jgi:hypothetical protein
MFRIAYVGVCSLLLSKPIKNSSVVVVAKDDQKKRRA